MVRGEYKFAKQPVGYSSSVIFESLCILVNNQPGKMIIKTLSVPKKVAERYLDLDMLRIKSFKTPQLIFFVIGISPRGASDVDGYYLTLGHIGDVPPIFHRNDAATFILNLSKSVFDLSLWSIERAARQNHNRDILKELAVAAEGRPILFHSKIASDIYKDKYTPFNYVTFTSIRLSLPQLRKPPRVCDHINLPKQEVEKYIDLSCITMHKYCFLAYPVPYKSKSNNGARSFFNSAQRTGLKLAQGLRIPSIFPATQLYRRRPSVFKIACDLTDWYNSHLELFL